MSSRCTAEIIARFFKDQISSFTFRLWITLVSSFVSQVKPSHPGRAERQVHPSSLKNFEKTKIFRVATKKLELLLQDRVPKFRETINFFLEITIF